MENDCVFTARGETEREVLFKMIAHLREAHTAKWIEMFLNMSQLEIHNLILSKITEPVQVVIKKPGDQGKRTEEETPKKFRPFGG